MFADFHIVRITENGMRSPVRALDIKPDTHEVVTAVPEPEVFVAGAMAYNGEWVITDQTRYDEVVQQRADREADALKDRKRDEIKAQYRTHPPVEVDGIMWNGGDASASAINGAVQLAQAAGETDVTLWDANDVNHPNISFEQAQNIAAQIALAYRQRMFERNQKLAEV
jgi:hypothetical protein